MTAAPGMVEVVARAMAANNVRGNDNWRDWLVEARAAIEAMREPTDAMLAATVPFPEHLVRERNAPDYEKRMAAATLAERMGVRSEWQQMIDAALKGEG